MTTSSAKLFLNKRKEPRNPYSGLISFVYKKNLYPGKLINCSPSGLFIESDSFFVEASGLPFCRVEVKTKTEAPSGGG